MKKKNESVFKVGDKVWHPVFKWVIITDIGEGYVSAKKEDKSDYYTFWYESISLLSFTEYEINANQVRPFEDGDILYGEKVGSRTVENISIYRDANSTYFHWDMTEDSVRHWCVPCALNSVHATKSQKQLLFDRLKKDGKRWNPETKQLEDLNDPKEGYDAIVWNSSEPEKASIQVIDEISTVDFYKYFTYNDKFERAILWDGTKEQFDNVRKGIIK